MAIPFTWPFLFLGLSFSLAFPFPWPFLFPGTSAIAAGFRLFGG
jgi:hypothetical protein